MGGCTPRPSKSCPITDGPRIVIRVSETQATDPSAWFRYWMREARIAEEDGHPDAARAAYAYAADAAPTAYQRAMADDLGKSMPTKG